MLKSFNLILTLQGPVLTRATEAGEFGIDAPIARNGDGKPSLNGTHIIGKIRHALQHLQEACATATDPGAAENWISKSDIEAWFGQADDQALIDMRRRVFCSDLVLLDGPSKQVERGRRTRIQIDPTTGTVGDVMLQTIEAPFASGASVSFAGRIDFLGAEDEIAQMRRATEAALRWTTQFGGLRTIGFGRNLDVKLEPRSLTAPNFASHHAVIIPLCLRFLDPFTIGQRRNASNIYLTGDVVPGGVIKGALASLMRFASAPSLSKYLSALRMTHFFPANSGSKVRPTRWPRSLAWVGGSDRAKGRFCDAALMDTFGPLDFDPIDGRAPAFASDWKPDLYAKADAAVGWPDVPRRLVVRTSIDFEQLSAAPAMLYAQEQCETRKHDWLGSLDLTDVPEAVRADLLTELEDVLACGLPGIGRSQSLALLSTYQLPTKTQDAAAQDALITLTLQTPTLLRAPDATYAQSITELSGGQLELVRHFATERLSGADFMANRYFSKREYKPWLLTEAGSVFVVKPTTETTPVMTWHETGLPLPLCVRTFYGLGADSDALWQSCPFIRQNGYGEVAVNMPIEAMLSGKG